MGTPDFAVASLDAMLNAGFNVVAVITAPDKPAGRGQKLQQSAVKQYAITKGLYVLQPEKLKNQDFLDDVRSLNADLQVVVAFRMLPEILWNMPPKGTINLHASLLPQYRGAAPINWAIINGEKESGVTTFFLKHEIDTGDLLFSEKVLIGDDDTAGDLHDQLMMAGAQLLVKTISSIAENNYTENPQDTLQHAEELKHAPKIFKEDCRINWNQPVAQIYNLIRGLSPYPASFTEMNGKICKIYKAAYEIKEPAIQPGAFLTDGKAYLKFAARDGFVLVKELQIEGKRKMSVEDFLRGVKL
jgi:methionyl-tRNA formyltransferase